MQKWVKSKKHRKNQSLMQLPPVPRPEAQKSQEAHQRISSRPRSRSSRRNRSQPPPSNARIAAALHPSMHQPHRKALQSRLQEAALMLSRCAGSVQSGGKGTTMNKKETAKAPKGQMKSPKCAVAESSVQCQKKLQVHPSMSSDVASRVIVPKLWKRRGSSVSIVLAEAAVGRISQNITQLRMTLSGSSHTLSGTLPSS